MERIFKEQQHLGARRTIAHTTIVKRISCLPPFGSDKSLTDPTTKLSPFPHYHIQSSKLAIIYVSLALLPTNPVLPVNYQNLKVFFRSLFRSYPYLTHKFNTS